MDGLSGSAMGRADRDQARQAGSRQRVLFVKEFASTPRLRNLSQIIIIRPRPGRVPEWMTKETNDGGGRLADILGWRGHGPVTLFHLLLS
jgi:hypothetical protein